MPKSIKKVKTFGNVTVKFTVTSYGSVAFYVNESCDYAVEAQQHKVAITRWLLSSFKKVQAERSYLYCIAYSGDGYGEMRKSIYQKLGFVSEAEDCNYMEWGTRPDPDEYNFYEVDDDAEEWNYPEPVSMVPNKPLWERIVYQLSLASLVLGLVGSAVPTTSTPSSVSSVSSVSIEAEAYWQEIYEDR